MRNSFLCVARTVGQSVAPLRRETQHILTLSEVKVAKISASQILAKVLNRHGVDTMSYFDGRADARGGARLHRWGIHSIDVRREQAAAMMPHAYARLRNRVGVCHT